MLSLARSYGVFGPEDVSILCEVFDRVSVEPWFTTSPAQKEEFARYIITMYSRGLVLPNRLENLSRLAAKKKYSRSRTDGFMGGRRVLVVEDEYVIAREAVYRLTELGAEVVGPVGRLSDAMDIVEAEVGNLDAALLDISLGGEMVYPVAASLKMNHIPFAFVTGYEKRQIPASFRSVPVFAKPADWGRILAAIPERSTSNAFDI